MRFSLVSRVVLVLSAATLSASARPGTDGKSGKAGKPAAGADGRDVEPEVLVVETESHAHAAPADEHPWRRAPDESSYIEDGAGPRFSFGRAMHRDMLDGWYGRFETEYFEQRAHGHRRRQGSSWGLRLGLEGWGSSEDWGAGVPVSAYGGYRQPMFRKTRGLDLFAALGIGLDVLSFDRVSDTSGVGVLTPRGEMVLGFDFGGLLLLSDAGIQYRWHFVQGDFLQLRVGISLGLHAELWDG